MNNVEIAAVLRKLAAVLDPSGGSALPAAQAATEVFSGTGQNAYEGSSPEYLKHIPEQFRSADPYMARPDIGTPGNQQALRAYAFRDGMADINQYIKDRNLTPIWSDAKEAWEQF